MFINIMLNGKEYRENGGLILADWVTQDFYLMNFSIARYNKEKIYLYNGWNEKRKRKEKRLRLKIEKGIVIDNRIKRNPKH